MLAADKRRKEAITVDRPAHIVAAQKAARAAARAKGAGGASSGGFASFRAMAENHVAYRAAPVTRQQPAAEPVAAVALPPAPPASVSHTDATSSVTSSE